MVKGKPEKQLKLARKFVNKHYPGETAIFQFNIVYHPGVNPEMLKLLGEKLLARTGSRIDLLVLPPGKAVIVEIKVKPALREVENLLFYRDALLGDPFKKDLLKDREIEMWFVMPWKDIRYQERCKKLGIKYEVIPLED